MYSCFLGGDASLPYVTTLPNILRQYNPDLYGFSNGTTPPYGFIDLPNTRLNVARSGAGTIEMLQQAQDLVRKIRESDSIDFDNDWKLVTLYVGSNDICKDSCAGGTMVGPESWLQNISSGLDYLQNNLPRTFVNLVQIIHLTDYHTQLNNTSVGPICRNFISQIGCPCGIFGQSSLGDQFEQLLIDYRQGLQELVDTYEDSDTFTVVLQPYQTELLFQPGDAILAVAAADCLHLNPIGNQQLAIGLWNNMLERVGEKMSRTTIPIININCPTEQQPFLFTAQNSRKYTPLDVCVRRLVVGGYEIDH